MMNLPAGTWLRFIIWMAIGFVVYFFYSARNSRLRTQLDSNGQAYAGSGGATSPGIRADEAGRR
jgi:APA family basic amino acid/polyamine antiporter